MTEVLTRQPLEQLSMASSQRGTRRRSSRGADGDDDAPPAKKAKVDDTARGTVKQVNGRKNATTSKQRKDGTTSQCNFCLVWKLALQILRLMYLVGCIC